MVVLGPYLFAALVVHASVAISLCYLVFRAPLVAAVLIGLLLAYKQWHYGNKKPKKRQPSTWRYPDPIPNLRKGDPLVDELVQGGFFDRGRVKYNNVVQMLKERIQQHPKEIAKQQLQDPEGEEKLQTQLRLCKQLLDQVEKVPDWVDEKKLSRASEIYRQHVAVISSGLASALVESYAFPIDAEVLFINGGLTTSQSGTVRRLMETGIWVFTVMKDGMKVGNSAHSAVINVRILHAFARKKCLECPSWRTDTIPIPDKLVKEGRIEDQMIEIQKGRIEGEMPVNQATMCGTLFLFCHVVMEIAQLRGADVSDEDKECYWHYWRYVGYLMGVDEAVMPHSYFDGLEARASPLYRGRQKPNEKSRTLSKETIESYQNLPNIPFQPGMFFVTIRKFLGDELSDRLGVPPTSILDSFGWHVATHFIILCNLLNSLFPPVKWLFVTGFCKYIENAFFHYFSVDKAGVPRPGSKCPFGI